MRKYKPYVTSAEAWKLRFSMKFPYLLSVSFSHGMSLLRPRYAFPFSARGPLYERIIFCLSSRLFMGCFCDVAIVNGVFVGVDAQKLI